MQEIAVRHCNLQHEEIIYSKQQFTLSNDCRVDFDIVIYNQKWQQS